MAEIKLTSGEIVLIDDWDLEKVSKYSWNRVTSSTLYASTKLGKRQIYMHRLIMHPEEDQFIDHINHNGLDNRRENLRIVTAQQNQMNKRKQQRYGVKNASSKYLGVRFLDRRFALKKPWTAQCAAGGKNITLGYFSNEEDAAAAYDIFKVLVDPEHSLLNENLYQQFTEVP